LCVACPTIIDVAAQYQKRSLRLMWHMQLLDTVLISAMQQRYQLLYCSKVEPQSGLGCEIVEANTSTSRTSRQLLAAAYD